MIQYFVKASSYGPIKSEQEKRCLLSHHGIFHLHLFFQFFFRNESSYFNWFNTQFLKRKELPHSLFERQRWLYLVQFVCEIVADGELFEIFYHNCNEQVVKNELPKNENDDKEHSRAYEIRGSSMAHEDLCPPIICNNNEHREQRV